MYYFYLQKELGAAVKRGQTATEQLVELFKAQQLADKATDDSQDIERSQGA